MKICLVYVSLNGLRHTEAVMTILIQGMGCCQLLKIWKQNVFWTSGWRPLDNLKIVVGSTWRWSVTFCGRFFKEEDLCNVCSTQPLGWANSAHSACWKVMSWWRLDTHLTWLQWVDFVFCSLKWNCRLTRWSQDMEDTRSVTVKLNTVPLDAFHDLCSSCRKIIKVWCKRGRLL